MELWDGSEITLHLHLASLALCPQQDPRSCRACPVWPQPWEPTQPDPEPAGYQVQVLPGSVALGASQQGWSSGQHLSASRVGAELWGTGF